MSYTAVLSGTIVLPVRSIVDVDGAAKQAFSAGDAAWGFQIWIDGVNCWDFGGTKVQDIVPLTAWKVCDPGTRTIELRWAGAPSITLQSRFLKARGWNNTSGA